ncbi:helix-turn-helix transcriptional regulator [Carnobacterium maltaromaticum]|uniref:Helix-turn-helix transcriptional regulator n=1 Tax=Carnobacterium maltaromaticum TaxID=2751 RepID=A0AAW9K4M1_CARML|nr:helix-turn-helix transcriptional regulator [Carnobacterium maltaromaticum]MDZ5760740.1 helix-turn-helix transcriptional regulator [Carnobacterium maltaromaticum]
MDTLGERIKFLREGKNLTQTELAEILGMKTYTTVSKWESNDNFPKGKDLKKLAETFNVSSDYLLGLESITEKNDINYIYNQLEIARQKKVDLFAEKQLEEQQTKNKKFSSLEEYRKKVPDAIDTLAAHSADRTRKYTDEEIENIKDILDSMIEEHKNNK